LPRAGAFLFSVHPTSITRSRCRMSEKQKPGPVPERFKVPLPFEDAVKAAPRNGALSKAEEEAEAQRSRVSRGSTLGRRRGMDRDFCFGTLPSSIGDVDQRRNDDSLRRTVMPFPRTAS